MPFLVLAGCGQAAPAGQALTSGPPARVEAASPALTGRVVDGANLLSVEVRASISAKLAALEQSTRHQFVVVTVNSLRGQSIEDYGLRLGRSWGVGRKNVNDGVLLIIAPVERRVRIEVGYGLEKELRDVEAKKIIDEGIVPAFRTGDFQAGINNGVDRVIREISPAIRLAA